MKKILIAMFLVLAATPYLAEAETSPGVASEAGKMLGDPTSTPEQKSVAGSALSQTADAVTTEAAAPVKKTVKKHKKVKKHRKAKKAAAAPEAIPAEAAPATK